jgi:hypothetical protein
MIGGYVTAPMKCQEHRRGHGMTWDGFTERVASKATLVSACCVFPEVHVHVLSPVFGRAPPPLLRMLKASSA